jgi:GNAT superfamily N-acetyltransferase
MKLRLEPATADDAAALAALHTAVADHLTRAYGRGPWSTGSTETGMLYALRHSHVFVARIDKEIVATLRLTTKKPWAIDTDYFSPARKPLYLIAMAVTPTKQRQGIGRACLEDVKRIAMDWPADALRLDAYDATAGAGNFYRRCGWVEAGRATYRGAALIYYEFQCPPVAQPR